ncbi:hypothetical protein L0664_12825 [Octadecabacter sp. G9-8]|uniref:Uncharacterized protein n=1 Tax=Octadecabacter dasysiphoniae TaxID=2909341 RepID=A0ABS9CXG5_9RHOB|nr:hypothetical protein [Octadecabacter dasysiphoniae]MCF2871955.1 hypothetical protein [Octadecabacter dasysiphoniae]
MIFGLPTQKPDQPEDSAVVGIVLDLPPDFISVRNPKPEPEKSMYQPAIVSEFETADGAVNLRIITEHDNDRLDIHRNDARTKLRESGADIFYTQFKDDWYSKGGVLSDGRSIHQTSRSFPSTGTKVVIVTALLSFDDANDVRATSLIRSLGGRLTLSGELTSLSFAR